MGFMTKGLMTGDGPFDFVLYFVNHSAQDRRRRTENNKFKVKRLRLNVKGTYEYYRNRSPSAEGLTYLSPQFQLPGDGVT
jgi:hypothetical protein